MYKQRCAESEAKEKECSVIGVQCKRRGVERVVTASRKGTAQGGS